MDLQIDEFYKDAASGLLQLYQAPWMQALRANKLAYLVLGNGFDPLDLLAYVVGIAGAAVVDGVWVVAGDEVAEAVAGFEAEGGLGKLRGVVRGGAERHLSVWEGLQALPSEVELVAVVQAEPLQ